MIFIVALDPASVEWAGQQGELGYDHLVGVLQSLLENCFIAETMSYRVGEELKVAVKSLDKDRSRKRATTLIETLVSPGRSRLYPVVDDSGFEYDVPLSDVLAAQLEHPEIDAIITEATPCRTGAVEVAKLCGFHQTNFAPRRSRMACGITYAPGSITAEELFRDQFRRLLLHGDESVQEKHFSTTDYMIGRDFGGNYSESLEHWCRFLAALDRRLCWTIHTQPGQCPSIQRFIEAKLDGSKVSVQVVPHETSKLPHERYFRASGFCLQIGRGIDLFDRDGMVKDIDLGLKNDRQFTSQYPHLM